MGWGQERESDKQGGESKKQTDIIAFSSSVPGEKGRVILQKI